MSDSSSNFDNQQLNAIIAECYEAREQGRTVDRAALLAKHPELRTELTEFFADLDQLANLLPDTTPPPPGPPSPGLDEQTHDAGGHDASSVVRRGGKIKYFGEYEVLEELGCGGMGVVYKARQVKLKKIVAVKMIRSGELARPREVQRFQAEARAAAKLDHPGIVSVHEVGIHEGHYYYTMDFVGGGSLSRLHRDEPMAARRAAELLKQLAEAMFYAHSKGIVHRDLKPANVLLTTTDVPRITDFGLAKRLWNEEDSAEASLTETGQVLGTAGYMSPEQAAGQTRIVGPAADIYALGAILYAMLTTRAPFIGESAEATIRQVIHNEPLAPRVLNASVPRDLETICLKCLEKEPHKRYGTAQLLADDLQRFLEGRPVLARPISRPARIWRWCRRNPIVAGLLATIATSLVLGISSSSYFAYTSHTNELIAIELAKEQSSLRTIAETNTDAAEQRLYLADLRLAGGATERREFGEVRSILSGHVPEIDRPDRRGWEWYYLLSKSQRRATTLYGHTGNVLTLAWNPAGTILASADSDGAIQLWNLARRDFVATISTLSVPKSLAWSPQGDQLAVALKDEIRIYDAETQLILRSIREVSGQARGLAWHAELPWLAWGDDSHGVTVFDLEKSNKIWTSPQGGIIEDTAWRPGTQHLAITNNNHSMTVWDVSTGAKLHNFTVQHDGYFGASWNSNGSMFASTTSYFSYSLALLNLANRQTQLLRGHVSRVTSADWHPDDSRVATGSLDRTVRIWNAHTGEVSDALDGHSEGVNDVAWSPQGTILASAGVDGTVVIWEMEPEADMPLVLSGHTSLIRRLEWAHDSNRLASIGWDSIARVWDVDSRAEQTTVRGDLAGQNNTLCWDPNGKFLVTDDKTDGLDSVHVWDVATATRINTIVGLPYNVEHVRWSPNGQLLLVTGHSDAAIVKPFTGVTVHRFKVADNRLCEGDWSPDSARIAIAGFDCIVSIFDVVNGDRIADFPKEDSIIETLRWSPDSRYIATGNRNGHINVREAKTGKLLHKMTGHRGSVNGVRWSPDSMRIASASHDGTVRIWDVRNGNEVLSLAGNVGILWSVAWSDNGERIAACSDSAKILVWDASSGYESASRNVIPWWLTQTPPAGSLAAVEPAIEAETLAGKHWHRYVTDFDTRVEMTKQSSADQASLALTWVHSPMQQRALLRMGHSGPLELWLNNKQVYRGAGYERARADQVDKEIQLREGWNQIALRVVTSSADESFYLRVADVDSQHPVRGLRFSFDRRLRQSLPDATESTRPREDYQDSPEWLLADTVLSVGGIVEIEGKAVSDRRELPLRRFNLEGLHCPEGFTINPFLAARLAEIVSLRRLRISTNRPDAKLFEQISKLPALEVVDLSGSNIGDNSTSLLSNFGELQSLDVSDTSLTAHGVEMLQARLHKIKILWNARENDRAVAARLSNKNAMLEIKIGQIKQRIRSGDSLPSVPFRIVSIKAEEKQGLTPADFEGFEKLDAIESIELLHTRLDDSVLERFKSLTKLKYLGCGNTAMKGEVLADFEPLPELKHVVFGGSLANASLAHFEKFPNLMIATLSWTEIDDAGLEKLPTLTRLTNLNLERTKISGLGLKTLSRFSNLEYLNLTHSLLTDDGLSRLPQLPKLKELQLRELPLTDASIPHLTNFRSLKKLDLSNSSFTADGITNLRKNLTGCMITWSAAK